jgi:protein-tyrosine-phosphatase
MKQLRPDLKIGSFAVGLKTEGGKLISKKMRMLLDQNKVPYDALSRSKILTKEVIEDSNEIYVMDENNIKHYKERFGNLKIYKVKRMGILIGEDKIKDPGFSEGMSEFIDVFNKIVRCCKILKEKR